MNKSVPTMLGIVIILLVVALVVLIVNYKTVQGLSEGKRVVGTVGGEIITGEEAPDEFLDEAGAASRSGQEDTKAVVPSDLGLREQQSPERRAPGEQRRPAGAPVDAPGD